MRPKVIIPTGIGINSHVELGKAFRNVGADVDFFLFNYIIANPNILDKYQMMGDPGGFMHGDHLGAAQSARNRIDGTPFKNKLVEKLADPNFPIYATCNSLQLFAKLDLFPVEIGTVRNASGKHETGSWDMKVNSKNDSPWLQYLIGYEGPIFAPISHGEGQITMTPEMLKKAEEINLIALTYFKGHMFNYQQSSKGDRYNPNASVADIAAVAWNNNFVVFPHFERLLRNLQRDDKALLQTKQILDRIYHSTPKGLYEPTYLLFKGAMDSIKY